MAACLGARPERTWLTNLEAYDAGLAVAFVETRVDVIRRAGTLCPSVVLLPLRDAAGVVITPLITRLRQRAPNVRVVLLLAPGDSYAGLAEAIRAGAEVTTLDGEADLRSVLFRTDCDRGLTVSEDDAARALLIDIQPAELRETMLFCVLQAHRRLSVRDLAASRGELPNEFGRRARAAHWPNATELIAWGRLLRASVLQWGGLSSLPALAQAGGFRNTDALQLIGARLLHRSIDGPRDLAPLLVSSRLQRRVQRLIHGS